MTVYYVDSAGSNTSPYDTWAKAANAIATIAAIDGAGDTIYVASTHSELTAATVTLVFAGTYASPTKIICASTAAEPPTTLATGAVIATSGATSALSIQAANNGGLYCYGITFKVGNDAAASADINLANSQVGQRHLYENCTFNLSTTTAGRVINACGNGTGSQVRWHNCDVNFANAANEIRCGGYFIWEDGSVLSGSTAITGGLITFGTATSQTSYVLASGIDLVNLGSAAYLFEVTNANGIGHFRDCKMPASWTATNVATGTLTATSRYEYTNCGSGDTNYKLGVSSYSGTLFDETTLVKTGGASDGTTGLSWKVTTTANASFTIPFRTGEIVKWNSTTGSSVTVTVDILHDSVTNLKDNEIWLEVMYLGTSGFPLGTFTSDESDILSSGTDQASSSSTWTTTGMTNPNKQALSVTFTPQEIGYIHAYITCAKASKTVYIDPELVVT